MLDCRFQETQSQFCSTQYIFCVSLLPGILPIACYSVMVVREMILSILLPAQVGPYTLVHLTLTALADVALNIFLCRLFHRLLSFIKNIV